MIILSLGRRVACGSRWSSVTCGASWSTTLLRGEPCGEGERRALRSLASIGRWVEMREGASGLVLMRVNQLLRRRVLHGFWSLPIITAILLVQYRFFYSWFSTKSGYVLILMCRFFCLYWIATPNLLTDCRWRQIQVHDENDCGLTTYLQIHPSNFALDSSPPMLHMRTESRYSSRVRCASSFALLESEHFTEANRLVLAVEQRRIL